MNTIIVCIGLFLIGSALHWSRAFWFADVREQSRDSSMGDALAMLAYHTQLAGVALALTFAMGPFSLIAIFLLIFAFAETAFRHSIQERRALAWIFASAVHHHVPIPEALAAFYESDSGKQSVKGQRLISLLSLGMPLHLALQGASIRQTPGLRLATAQGVTLGALPERLARAISEEEELEEDLQRLNQKIGYSATVILTSSIALFMATGMLIFIVPTLETMFIEFGLELPDLTILTMAISRFAVDSMFVSFGLMLFLASIPLLALIVGLHQFGFYLWEFPLLVRLFPAFDRARLYRSLAMSIRRHESMLAVFDQLGIFFPRSYMRNRIRRARNRFVKGETWIAAMSTERLIPRADRRLLEAAEVSGNVSWSLEELAAIRSHRQIQRLESFVSVVNTIMVVLVGVFVFIYGGLVYMCVAKLTGELG